MAKTAIKEFMIINKRSQKALQTNGTENGSLVTQEEPTKSDEQIWFLEKNTNGTRIIHKLSGKTLDLKLGADEKGTLIHLWDKTDNATQFWKITGGISRKVANACGKVMDIADISDSDGTPIQIWDDVGGENQRWRFVFSD